MLHANNASSLYANEDAMRVLVNLDALMDLRLAAIMLLHPDIAFLAATDNAYYSRKVDEWQSKDLGKVTKSMVDSICEKFKYEITQACEPTRLLEVLQDFCIAYFKKSITGPAPNKIEITVNLEGYPFTDEQVKSIGDSIYARIKGLNVEVSFMSLELKDLKLAQLETQYDAFYIYNWHVFHNANVDELKSRKYRQTAVYTPKLLFGRLPTKDEYEHFIKMRVDIFKAATLEIAPYLRLEFLPVEYYCALTPYNNMSFENRQAPEGKAS